MTHLQEGDEAPDFKGINEKGKTVKLSDYKGKKLILFFYPKDDSPGCTKEACNLRDNFKKLKKMGFEILGVSPDSSKKHQKFIDKYEFQYSLIADEDRSIINAYGIWGPKKFMGREYDGLHRTTFIIDEEGNIEKIISKVKTKEHTEQILNEMSYS
ncbi:thioredoxin-dependent thiol peroxidase [Portibacter marinus]|uniref:thioredoxin-dependent thiol peroxidase n=1 Tax=Portibacter marinus TaxID=2898660 RepID=UPI001F318B2E|nr:thioredoxin-dependent thiol peroxidase [Portibacter marinus]